MPNKPPRRSSPSRTSKPKKHLSRRKGKSRTDATPPPAKTKGPRPSLAPRVLSLYGDGFSVSEIAHKIGTSHNRVYIHLKRAGLPSPTKRKPQAV